MIIDDFILRALIIGVGIAIICSFLGCFVVWRKMSYFGDAISHSALLGIALGIIMGINVSFSTLAICVIFSLSLYFLVNQKILAIDSLLGILSHSSLSLGIIIISLWSTRNFDLHSFLFGDILTVSLGDIFWVFACGTIVIIALIMNFEALTLISLNEELAQVEGVNIHIQQILLIMLIAITVALSIPIIGVLLVASLLILPASTARILASSPHKMVMFSMVFGLLSVILGINASYFYDTPSGPTIVLSSALMFLIVLLFVKICHKNKKLI